MDSPSPTGMELPFPSTTITGWSTEPLYGFVFSSSLASHSPFPSSQSSPSAIAASDLWDIREPYLSLLTDLVGHDADLAHIREERDQLQEALKNAYQGAPRTTNKAYKLAQEALKITEELTFLDSEIDNLLPKALRKTK